MAAGGDVAPEAEVRSSPVGAVVEGQGEVRAAGLEKAPAARDPWASSISASTPDAKAQ